MTTEKARRIELYILMNKKDVTVEVFPYVRELTATDVATGEADGLDIMLYGDQWINEWTVDKGTLLCAGMQFFDWEKDGDRRVIDFGENLVDSITVSGSPLETTIRSISVPINGTKHTRKWENISISQIARSICALCGCGLQFLSSDIVVKSEQQSHQTDINFLYSLCSRYGFGMKVYRHDIVIYNREDWDAKPPVGTYFLDSGSESFTIKDNTEGIYTGAMGYYKPEESDETYTAAIGTPEKYITLENCGESLYEAVIKLRAALYNANVERVKLKFTTSGEAVFYAGTNYYFYGIGKYSGAYAVERVTHTITGQKAYRQVVECHAVALEMDREIKPDTRTWGYYGFHKLT